MMVGRDISFSVDKKPAKVGDVVFSVKNLTVMSRISKREAVKNVSFDVRAGEICCIAGIDGNGQTELIYALTGLEKASGGKIELCGNDFMNAKVRQRHKGYS